MNKVGLNLKGQFSLVANFYSIEGKEEQLKEILDDSFTDSIGAEGLIQAYLFKPRNKRNPYVFTAIWESEEHFQNFMQSPKAKEKHKNEHLRKLHEEALKKATAEMYSVRDEWHLDH